VRAQPPGLERLVPAIVDALQLANGYVGAHLFLEGASLLIVMAVATHARMPRGVALPAALIAVVTAIAAIVPSLWVLRHPPPPRALYVVSAALAAAAFGAFAGTRRKAAGALLIVLAVIPLLSALETQRTLGEARVGAAAVDAILHTLETQRGRDAVVQSPWPFAPRYFLNDPTHWANRCVCAYYGLRSLRVEHYRFGKRLQP
jgi:hypothetical protein